MKKFISSALALSLMLLAGCEPQGPAANVEDHIDEVVNTTDSVSAPPVRTRQPAPAPEVTEQQKQQHRQVIEQASQEAQNKLEQILENS
ncbi:hypothetical protein Q9290_04625 [Oceanimonas sp. CHS3-5]|uniref:hypothetical protein n=1 Tax=Oceanimonas sp. CHS3-5 TaxID=3068186 RepID=UPI00273D2943|nr:hypothetical protein [Oceanimonas sp. CHS3-5]MDP5291572.1 hypothetical protein [Oceanimonas sp. CHS3-5]